MSPKKTSLKNAFSIIELSIVILIIGILIAGVTQGSRLVGAFRLSTARSLTQSSAVVSIPGIVMWLESTGANAINVEDPEDQQVVTTWNDINPQSSFKRNPTQGGADSLKPKIITGALNNLPVVRFDGSDDFLNITSLNVFDICPTSQITIFVAGKLRANTATQVLLSLESGAERISIEFNSSVPRFDFVNGNAGSGQLIGSGSIFNTNTILTFHKNAGTQTIFVNGLQNATQNRSVLFTNLTGPFLLGKFSSVLNTSIDLGEFIIFDRGLKTEERKAVESYLSKKWAIPVS